MAVEILVPRLGWSMDEGTFTGWLVSAGTQVKRGQALFTLEGEKATQDIEAIGDGVLHIAPNAPCAGQVVPVGKLIGLLCAPNEIPVWKDSIPSPQSNPYPVQTSFGSSVPVAAPPSVRRLARKMGVDLNSVKPSWPGGGIRQEDLESISIDKSIAPNVFKSGSTLITPRARRCAAQNNTDSKNIVGSGRNGRIREIDVIKELENQTIDHSGLKIPTTGIRRSIARNMTISRQHTVPVTLTTKADATALLASRSVWKQQFGPLAPTINDALLLILAESLVSHPHMAAQWQESHINLPSSDGFHIGLAVDTPSGLLVPVIRNAPQFSLQLLAEHTRVLIRKARENFLQQNEMSDGVFTVSNLGNFGVEYFNPVINYPQCAIMGIGSVRQEVFPDVDAKPTFRPMLPLSLTFDHRIVDGAPAARFLQSVVKAIEGYVGCQA